MSDPRDTNHDGKVSFVEKVKGMFHPHHEGTATSGFHSTNGGTSSTGGMSSTGTGIMPTAGTTGGIMPTAGTSGGIMPTAGTSGGIMPTAGGIMPTAGGIMPTAGGIMPMAGGIMPMAGGIMPTAGAMPTTNYVCQDPNCPDNTTCDDPNCSRASAATGGSGFYDSRDLNRDGHISTGERLAGLSGSGFHDSRTTGLGGSGFHDSRDLNRDGHISTGERLAGATGLGGSGFHDSRDLNRDGHISTGERLAGATGLGGSGFHDSRTTGLGGSGFHDSRDLNRDGHVSTGERLASDFGGRSGFDDASRLRLHEEQLAVSKRQVGAGEVDVHKRVQEHQVQQTVPLRHQELSLERHALHGAAEPGAQISSQDEIIHVPLYREELLTEKRVVPTEEVIVRKNELVDNQTVGATLRSEYVEPTKQVFDQRDVNHDGHVSMGEKFQNMSMNNGYDVRDTNHDGHVSLGEKAKGAFGTNTAKAARG